MSRLASRTIGLTTKWWRRLGHRRPALAAVAAVVVVLACAGLYQPVTRQLTAASTVTVVAVGDMACDPADPDMKRDTKALGDRCRQQAVSDLAVALRPAYLIGLGDLQYETPTATAYRTVYGPSFGRLRDHTVPVFGNQEYRVQDASSFVTYFGKQVHDARGYWSQEIGSWHLVVLNSNCSAVTGGCDNGSPQQTWLAHDLAQTGDKCVVAAWHHPRWSTGIAGSDPRTADLFRTLYAHHVELVLSGHEADYERFPPLNPDGAPDPQGVRQFVVGTGGQAHYRPDVVTHGGPAGAFADYDHHGVLELTLNRGSYSWRFHPLEAAAPTEDAGKATCF